MAARALARLKDMGILEVRFGPAKSPVYKKDNAVPMRHV